MTVQELYESIGGSYENAKRTLQMDKLIARFVVKLLDDKSCEKLMAAKDTLDPTAMFEGSHALKGVCANLGLMNLSEQASAISEEFRPNNPRTMDDAEVRRRMDALKADYDRAIEGIAAFAAEQ